MPSKHGRGAQSARPRWRELRSSCCRSGRRCWWRRERRRWTCWRPRNLRNTKAVDQVGAEQTAEEHDFGGEEDPHAETGGVALLLFGREVMQQCGVVQVLVIEVDAAWLSDNFDLLLVAGVDLVVVVGFPSHDGFFSKLKVVGGEGVFHSRPAAFHGLSGAGLP